MIAYLWQDLRYGVRTLLKQPGFTSLALLTLALGAGSATTIFSAVWNILMDPFPYPDAHRMVAIRIQDTSGRGRGRGPQTPEFLDYQEQNHVFEDIEVEQHVSSHTCRKQAPSLSQLHAASGAFDGRNERGLSARSHGKIDPEFP